MWKTAEGSTGRLIQLCLGYYLFYVITGVTVKWFLGQGMKDIEFTLWSTIGGSAICLAVVFACGWYRMQSAHPVRWGGVTFPGEWLYILPSGVCTAVVIVNTTLLYTLPISVMVAMVIMRGAIIVVSRLVDEIQLRQGILHKTVYREENWAVVFALLAVATNVLWVPAVINPIVRGLGRLGLQLAEIAPVKGAFAFLYSTAALAILGSYILAYLLRIYIMNYYKNTAGKGVKRDNRAFFGVEQIAASVTMLLAGFLVYFSPRIGFLGWGDLKQVQGLVGAVQAPNHAWGWAILAGTAYGMVAFFSVFIFMFKGRTATFAGLVNRLTSLVAGTTATLAVFLFFKGKFPKPQDWVSLFFILVAVAFLTAAERRRVAELVVTHELDAAPAPAAGSPAPSLPVNPRPAAGN